MNSSWLLLFKEDMVSQPVRVQKALFEQFVLLVLDVPGLALLEEAAARAIVRDVFIQSIHTGFTRLSCEDIEAVLKFRVSEAVQLHKPQAAPPAGEERHCEAATLLQGWPEIDVYLSKKKKRRGTLRQCGIVGGLVIILLSGGFTFGTEGTHKKTIPDINREKTISHQEGEDHPPVSRLINLSVDEQKAKAYADFTMVTPTYLPPGYSFCEGEVWVSEGASKAEHAVLTYTNAEKHLLRLTFFKLHKNGAITSGMFSPSISKEVFLRGNKGLVQSASNGQFQMNWIEHDDTYIVLSGRDVAEEHFMRMAESLK